MQCQCLTACGSAASAPVEAPDPDGPDRDLIRLSNCSSLLSRGDASTRGFCVHYHTAYASGQAAVHLIKIGKQPGVHMCSCMELAQRGLPCRHYFAVLLHDQSVQFDLNVIHPRWFTRSTIRSLTARIGATPQDVRSPADAERLKAVQYLTMDAIKGKIEQLSGNVRGLKSKAEYAERLVSVEHAALQQQQALSVAPTTPAPTQARAGAGGALTDMDGASR